MTAVITFCVLLAVSQVKSESLPVDWSPANRVTTAEIVFHERLYDSSDGSQRLVCSQITVDGDKFYCRRYSTSTYSSGERTRRVQTQYSDGRRTYSFDDYRKLSVASSRQLPIEDVNSDAVALGLLQRCCRQRFDFTFPTTIEPNSGWKFLRTDAEHGRLYVQFDLASSDSSVKAQDRIHGRRLIAELSTAMGNAPVQLSIEDNSGEVWATCEISKHEYCPINDAWIAHAYSGQLASKEVQVTVGLREIASYSTTTMPIDNLSNEDPDYITGFALIEIDGVSSSLGADATTVYKWSTKDKFLFINNIAFLGLLAAWVGRLTLRASWVRAFGSNGNARRPHDYDESTARYLSIHGDVTAKSFLHPWQISFCIISLEWFLLLACYSIHLCVSVACLLLICITIGSVVFRFVAFCVALLTKCVVDVGPEEIIATPNAEWPAYTILVPLFREQAIAETVVRYLAKLDYPADRLEILLLLEQEDDATWQAVRQAEIPKHMRIVTVPPSWPQTKPKACNVGLQVAQGQFVVIYDAEDRPEVDQLKKVVTAFSRLDQSTVCLQAKLNFYNPRQNLLTKWFALEYTVWYEYYLAGLVRLNTPIPLGGTSNHFRVEFLRQLGGWDPFNVTEDCDLGMRIARLGKKTQIINSLTWEEANSQLVNWINQRSRWIKGYFQTHITHMRHPIWLWRAIGAKNMVAFYFTVGWHAVTQVINPLLWLIAASYVALLALDMFQGRSMWDVVGGHRNQDRFAWKMLYYGPGETQLWAYLSTFFFVTTIALLFANSLFVLMNLVACRKHGYQSLWLAAVLSPGYWGLISLAALKGLWQLLANRYYWEKTRHGLDKQ